MQTLHSWLKDMFGLGPRDAAKLYLVFLHSFSTPESSPSASTVKVSLQSKTEHHSVHSQMFN